MNVSVLINAGAGRKSHRTNLPEEIRARFVQAGVVPRIVHLTEPARLTSAVEAEAQSGAEALVAAGGDGTISAVAEGCVRYGIPLGVLPLGTFNHFARDAGIPLDLESAVACVVRSKRRTIDVGTVNGRIFINNSSIGVYPRAVAERADLQSRLPLRKQVAMAIAVLRVFARKPLLFTRIEADGRELQRLTPFVFVGNNDYGVHASILTVRPVLDAGKLCVYTARCTGLMGFFKLFWQTLARRLEASKDFEKILAEAVKIDLPRDTARVARDGEITIMKMPLEYGIRKKALELIVP